MNIHLTQKEAGIIYLRYCEHKTLEEIGRAYGVTRERIRQIEAKVIERIRLGSDLAK